MQRVFWFIVVGVLGLFSLSACSSAPVSAPAAQAGSDHAAQDGQLEHDMEHNGSSMGGHIHADPPSEYAKLTNPFTGDAAALAAGQTIFNTNCMTCHGAQGQGDGPTSVALNPKPANLADRQMMDMLSDGYLFWRVSEGGAMAPFNSAMPSWKAALSEEQRWQVISYVRSLGR